MNTKWYKQRWGFDRFFFGRNNVYYFYRIGNPRLQRTITQLDQRVITMCFERIRI